MELEIAKSEGFQPQAQSDARVLILGTLPGKASLKCGEYYADPRNAFWRIMGELFGAWPSLPYDERLRLLKEKSIALWDVCAAAHRLGSLDSAIQLSTLEANDLSAFLRSHRHISQIFFNGSKAKKLYDRKVLPKLPIRCEVLPSTSPANARMSYEQKLSKWSIVRGDRTSLAPDQE